LHGFWRDAESVVLNLESYEEVMGATVTDLLRAAAVRDTLIMVGIGGGIEDPNLGALRKWMSRILGGSPYRHYRLVNTSEEAAAREQHSPDERVTVVTYGQTYEELIPFLRSLAPERSSHPAPAKSDAVAVIAVRELAPGLLELLTDTHDEFQVEVNGQVARVVARTGDVVRITIPETAVGPYDIAVTIGGMPVGRTAYRSQSRVTETPWHKVVATEVPLFADEACSVARDEVGVIVESHEGGRPHRRVFPSARPMTPGHYVSWDWDGALRVGRTFWSESEDCQLAWDSSIGFAGVDLGAPGRPAPATLTLHPRHIYLALGDSIPVRITRTVADGIVAWSESADALSPESTDDAIASMADGWLTARAPGRCFLRVKDGPLFDQVEVEVGALVGGTCPDLSGGFGNVVSLAASGETLAFTTQGDAVYGIEPGRRIRALARLSIPDYAHGGLNDLAFDDVRNLYVRSTWGNAVAKFHADSTYTRVDMLSLDRPTATIMSVGWAPEWGLVVADHGGGVSRLSSNQPWLVELPVIPIGIEPVGSDLVVLGGPARPGLVRLRLDQSWDYLLEPGDALGLSAVCVRGEQVLAANFRSGEVFEVAESGLRRLASGLSNPTDLVWSGHFGLLAANFGSGSIARVIA
jgi:hypothetical protein